VQVQEQVLLQMPVLVETQAHSIPHKGCSHHRAHNDPCIPPNIDNRSCHWPRGAHSNCSLFGWCRSSMCSQSMSLSRLPSRRSPLLQRPAVLQLVQVVLLLLMPGGVRQRLLAHLLLLLVLLLVLLLMLAVVRPRPLAHLLLLLLVLLLMMLLPMPEVVRQRLLVQVLLLLQVLLLVSPLLLVQVLLPLLLQVGSRPQQLVQTQLQVQLLLAVALPRLRDLLQ